MGDEILTQNGNLASTELCFELQFVLRHLPKVLKLESSCKKLTAILLIKLNRESEIEIERVTVRAF